MKVAIAGAGLAGLGLAWHLLQHSHVSVTVFDPRGVGGGASGVSTGLLHPFPGRFALRSWQADEGMSSSVELLSKVEKHCGYEVARRGGILRFALTEEQQRNFFPCTEFGCQWWPAEKVKEMIPKAVNAPALWIPHGMTVYARPYIEGLWQLCESKGAVLKCEPFSEKEGFDRIVLAMGSEIPQTVISSLDIPLNITRGQALLCRWLAPPPFALLSQGHLTFSEIPDQCQIGSTYEDPNTPQDVNRAYALREKIGQFYPPAKEFEILRVQMGYRIARQRGYRPIISQIDSKTWVFFGLGSRGLLYHSLLGQSLAMKII
ncbi:MAG: FAD-binding oxidoreductase [Chlamydiales bacterium]|nr:FAD-binding oxidoreductase [Chlamydiales bacterium]